MCCGESIGYIIVNEPSFFGGSSWSVLVATEARSRLQKIDISRLDLLRMTQQIHLSPTPSRQDVIFTAVTAVFSRMQRI
ncbi:hypothetical protein DPMN_056405 [Dreissena polymorpha]|uniref:Uncharacterized protein n=1 Tax=Dreissena polymorpha TaxID=45954 RepID=A0A9D4HT53_DREPO|nr:hypothetical protein DPMN_056405 [Dreissena polymorpha]